jgi:hypothetical protein
MSRRGDLARNDADAGRDEHFAGYASLGILRQYRVEDGVGYVIGDFVRVTFGH